MSGHTIHTFGRIFDDEGRFVGITTPEGLELRLLVPQQMRNWPSPCAELEGQIITMACKPAEPSSTWVCHGDGEGGFTWVKLA